MKRSRAIKLVTMASTTVLLASCGERTDTEGELYKTELQCEQGELVPDEECEGLIAEGTKIHSDTAPRYNTMALCEREHGFRECETRTGEANATYYSPSPTGFFIAAALASATNPYTVRPVYRTRDRKGYYMTGGGSVVYLNNGRYGTTSRAVSSYNPNVKTPPPRVQTRTTVVSRGGFGSRSSGRGWGG